MIKLLLVNPFVMSYKNECNYLFFIIFFLIESGWVGTLEVLEIFFPKRKTKLENHHILPKTPKTSHEQF